MEWEKAKNIVMVLLLILNISLCGLQLAQNSRNELSETEQQAAEQVLSERGMTLACDWLTDYAPLRELAVTIPAMEPEAWRERVFAAGDTVTMQVDFDRSFLRSETATLMLADNQISLLLAGSGPVEPFTEENARRAAESFLQGLASGEGTLYLGRVEAGVERYELTYYKMYKGYPLFDCSRTVTVTPRGVTYCTAAYYESQGFLGERQAICTAAEALMTLCYGLEAAGETGPYVVEEISLGYALLEERQVETGNTLTMTPCYLVRLQGRESPYLIQAYTNTLLSP